MRKNLYYDEYKKYNYWNQRFMRGPNNKNKLSFLVLQLLLPL